MEFDDWKRDQETRIHPKLGLGIEFVEVVGFDGKYRVQVSLGWVPAHQQWCKIVDMNGNHVITVSDQKDGPWERWADKSARLQRQ